MVEEGSFENLVLLATEMMPAILEDRPSIAIMEQVLPEGLDRGTAVPGEAASPILAELADALAVEADKFSAGFPLFKLLMDLRYLPSWIYGSWELRYPTVSNERRTWAEILAARSATQTARDVGYDEACHITLTADDLPDLLRHVEISRMYGSLQVLMRCANMDVPILFPVGKPPALDLQSPEWPRVSLYDRRRDAATGAASTADADTSFQFLAVIPSADPAVPDLSVARRGDLRINGFRLGKMSSPVPGTLAGIAWHPPELPAFVAASYALLAMPAAQDPEFEEGVRRLGLGVLRREVAARHLADFAESDLDGQLNEWFPTSPPSRTAEVVSALKNWGGFESGLRGPIWLNAGPEAVVIDYVALTEAIHLMISGTGTGAIVNRRAQVFEDEVQRIIDESPWRPAKKLRQMVGSKVKRANGSQITNIDAIAVKDDLCLLISCKNMPFQIHTRSNSTRLRNLLSDLRDYTAQWNDKIAEMEAIRETLNPHLASAGRFVPLLVTPEPSFANTDLLEVRPDVGLPSVMSREEFAHFLRTGTLVEIPPHRL